MQIPDASAHPDPLRAEARTHARINDAACAWLLAEGDYRDAARKDLQAEVAGAVREMRDGGMPPEKVIVRVKTAVRAACSARGAKAPVAMVLDAMVSDVVKWSIAEYYRVS